LVTPQNYTEPFPYELVVHRRDTRLVEDLLDLILDCDKEGILLRKQIPYLIDVDYEYTGVGLYVTFNTKEGIEDFLYNGKAGRLDRVEIKSEELGIGAEASVSFSNGRVQYLEIWSYDGIYPKKELTSYTARQLFISDPDKIRGVIRW
jgi:hypothetical protein